MERKKVKDLMIPCDVYPTVSHNADLMQAIKVLEDYQQNLPEKAHPYRAVLVVDDDNRVIGKVGHFAFLKALEPKYATFQDFDKLSKANLSEDFINSLMDNYSFWQDNFLDICKKVQHIKIKDIMHSVNERIDENASLLEAMHKIIMWGSLSILVSGGDKIVGLIRISDIYNEITQYIRNNCNCT
jgi:predicted transcriptional regulator